MKMNLNYAALLLQLSLVTIILLKFFVCGQSHKMETKKPNASSSPHLLLRRRVKRIGVPALIAMFGPPPPAFNQGSSASASAASAAGSAASNVPAYNAPPQPPQFSQQQVNCCW
jgi:hypothetical protein